MSDPRGPDAPGMSAEERAKKAADQTVRLLDISDEEHGCIHLPNEDFLCSRCREAIYVRIITEAIHAAQADAERRAQEAEARLRLADKMAEAATWVDDQRGPDEWSDAYDALRVAVSAYRASAPGGSSHE